MLQKLQTALAASIVSLAAGVSSADAATTVKFWHSFNKSNGETLDRIIAGFEAANPGIDIEAEYVGSYNDIIAKLQAAIPARRRIAVMRDGHLLQFDRPEVIYDRPSNRFVASFLGSPPMNFLASNSLPGWTGAGKVTVGLRPDLLTVHHEKPNQPALPGRLLLSEMTGSDMLLHCETPAGRLTVSAPRETVARETEQLWIGFDLDRALFFDPQNGDRIDLPASGHTEGRGAAS